MRLSTKQDSTGRRVAALLASAAMVTVLAAATPASAFSLDDWLDGRFGGTALRVMPQTAFAPRTEASFATPEYRADYGLAKINAAEAYALGYTGKGVLVAVVDTGLDTSLPEFAGRISPWSRNFGFDRPIGSSDIRDIDSHGTHVAGTIAAARDGVGMHGVAYNAEILALRAIVNNIGGDTAAAIAYAAERGAKVLNGSYGPAYPSRFLPDGRVNPDYELLPAQPYGILDTEKEVKAIRKAMAADMLLIFAAGNDGQDQPTIAKDPSGAGFYPFIRPGNYAAGKYGFFRNREEIDGKNLDYSDLQPYTLVVVAVDKDNRIASFSNRCGVAAAWCLAAPGVDTVSTMPRGSGAGGGDYDAKSGTSMAAPHVAGAAALVREAFPFFSAPNVATTLLTTATSLGDPTIYGWGLVNVGKALRGPAQFAGSFNVDTRGGSGTFANDISGVGRLVKRGEGRLELTGANTYAGGTAILGGTLALNGSLSSAVTVERDGALRGTGRIDAALASFGTVRPGNSPGTLTVTGPIGFATSSRLAFDIDGAGIGAGAGNYSRLIGLGPSASVTAGGRLAPILRGIDGSAGNSFTPALGQSFAVLVAGGGLSGSFSGLDQPSDGLPRFTRFDALYRAQGLDLVVTPASYAGLSALGLFQNGNARALGSAIDAARPAAGTRPDSAQRELFDPLYTTTPTSLAATIGSLSGQSYADAMKAQLGGSRLLAGAIDRRLADAASARDIAAAPASSAGFSALSGRNDGDAVKPQAVREGQLWGEAIYGFGRQASDAEAASLSHASSGALVGVERRFGNDALLGLAGGYLRTEGSTGSAMFSRFAVGSYNATAYGGASFGNVTLRGSLGAAYADTSVDRGVMVGALARSAHGEASGFGLSGQSLLGYRLPLMAGVAMTPEAGVSFDRLQRASLRETGASVLGLAVSGDTVLAARSLVGGRMSLSLPWSPSLSLDMRAYWAHEFGDGAIVTRASLLGAGFAVRSAGASRDAAVLGLNLSGPLSGALRLAASYDGELRQGASSHRFSLGVRGRW